MTSTPRIILLKSQLFRRGGAEKYTLRIAQAFRNKQCPVTILTSESTEPLSSDPLLQVISHKFSSSMSFRKLEEFDKFCARYLAAEKREVVFGLDRNRFQTHLRASNGVHAAYLQHRRLSEGLFKQLTYEINPLHRTLLKIEKESFEHPELQMLFTNSFMVRDEILQFYSTDPKKIHVVHNGVEWLEMQKDFEEWPEKRQAIAESLGLDPHIFHFIFIGHNYQRKGLEKFLQGLSLLPHRNFQLSVIGKEKNVERFLAISRQLNVHKQVRFFGNRQDIRSFYQLADALVIPSFYDPFANVTVEALAMGVFVISSKTNGGHEILTPINGITIESLHSREAIAAALQVALDNPKTRQSAEKIRQSVRHLDFSEQLELFTDIIL